MRDHLPALVLESAEFVSFHASLSMFRRAVAKRCRAGTLSSASDKVKIQRPVEGTTTSVA
jgi:hypothetical protein